ncbi:MAG: hypothetical protein NTY23_13550 [Chloroflexi bacterium]|nr:hypothetical protein [Chloroflexota bacterium]
MESALAAALWLILSALLLVLAQRLVQQTVQQALFLLTGRLEWALFLYALILLPGVILHEGSHWLTAKLLRMRTGRISLWPKLQREGTLRLGYVETEEADFLRSSLVGVAPLIAGIIALLVLGQRMLHIDAVGLALAGGELDLARQSAAQILGLPLAGLWIYLVFAVSNTMFPSASDRRSWPWVGWVLGVLLVITLLTGVGEWFVDAASRSAMRIAQTVALAFSMTIVVDAALLPGLALLNALLRSVRGKLR